MGALVAEKVGGAYRCGLRGHGGRTDWFCSSTKGRGMASYRGTADCSHVEGETVEDEEEEEEEEDRRWKGVRGDKVLEGRRAGAGGIYYNSTNAKMRWPGDARG